MDTKGMFWPNGPDPMVPVSARFTGAVPTNISLLATKELAANGEPEIGSLATKYTIVGVFQ